MKTLLLSCRHPDCDPRPFRMRKTLRDLGCYVTLGTYEDYHPSESSSETLINLQPSNPLRWIMRLLQILCPKTLSKYIYIFYKNPLGELKNQSFDIIICHDLVLLPLAVNLQKSQKKHGKSCRLVFDAREYYPLEFESSFWWRLHFQRFFTALCQGYLSSCQGLMTVSQGVKNLYKTHFNVQMEVVYSLPLFHDLSPSPVKDKIQLVYHGAANIDRGLEDIITMMEMLKDRYHLTLILVPGSGGEDYIHHLEKNAKNLPVTFLDPLPFEKIISHTQHYDIGLCCFPPATANLSYCMPNKLFEYLQSRLMVMTTPLKDMADFVQKEGVGVVSDDFSPKSMAKCLLTLTDSQIMMYKKHNHTKARHFSYEGQNPKMIEIIMGSQK